jgi:hypothetical protein
MNDSRGVESTLRREKGSLGSGGDSNFQKHPPFVTQWNNEDGFGGQCGLLLSRREQRAVQGGMGLIQLLRCKVSPDLNTIIG